jgi:hypothetical protein
MTTPVTTVFRTCGTVVDEFLNITDILARLVVSKEQYGEPSLPAAVLLSANEPAYPWSGDPLLRHLIENSRPLSFVNTWWNYRDGEGPQARLECGEIPVCMVTSDGGADTEWDCIMDVLRDWIWDNADFCTLDDVEDQLESLVTEYMSTRSEVDEPWH